MPPFTKGDKGEFSPFVVPIPGMGVRVVKRFDGREPLGIQGLKPLLLQDLFGFLDLIHTDHENRLPVGFQDKTIGVVHVDLFGKKKLRQTGPQPPGWSGMTTARTRFNETVIPACGEGLLGPPGSSTIRLMTPKVSDVAIVVARILIFSFVKTRVTAASRPGLFSAKIES